MSQSNNNNKQSTPQETQKVEDIKRDKASKTTEPVEKQQSDLGPELVAILEHRIGQLDAELKSSKAESEDWKKRALSQAAEGQNIIKQSQLQNEQVKKNTKKKVVQSIADFLNTLNLSFNFTPETKDEKVLTFVQTLRFSYSSLINSLQSEGVEIIVPEINQEFDPQTMTAINAASNDVATVKAVVTIGIKIDGQIIQPASVMLA